MLVYLSSVNKVECHRQYKPLIRKIGGKKSHIQSECVYLYINMHDSFLPNSLTEGKFKSGGVDMSPNKSSCSMPCNRVEKEKQDSDQIMDTKQSQSNQNT